MARTVGTIHFSSTDKADTVPGDFTFKASDAGVRTFKATFKTLGTQVLTVTDKHDAKLLLGEGIGSAGRAVPGNQAAPETVAPTLAPS